jgi:hypothetical protein
MKKIRVNLRNLRLKILSIPRSGPLTRSCPLARPSRAFGLAEFLSPFPKRLKSPFEAEREIILWGRFPGVTLADSLTPGYYLSPRWGCNLASRQFPSPRSLLSGRAMSLELMTLLAPNLPPDSENE